ncbi:MAG TPA: metallophosphoesterase [Thermoanaerobaculia bacterium]|nr:metallophosphoesterase [Thermoanaerobaculia bacterium]
MLNATSSLNGPSPRPLPSVRRRPTPAPPPPIEPERIVARQGSFVVVGGLRSTPGFEAWRISTPRERRAVLKEVSGEKPDFVALLGDLVFCGSSADAWLDYDRVTSPLKSSGVPAYPVLGNHDYWLTRRSALSNYFARFPHLRGRHWYAAAYGGIGLAFLDSNVRWLTAGAWQEQIDWYERLLAQWDADREILGTIVLLYHPAFSRRTSTDILHVQRDLLPIFLRSRKTLAMLSGLVHDDSPVFRDGRAFLAAGGTASSSFAASAADPTSALRYLRLRPEGGGVAVEIRSMDPEGSGFATAKRFDLRWAD